MIATAVDTIQRVDQWLWFARVAKSRTLAQALIARGKVRINRNRLEKPSATVKPGDVLTLTLGPTVRILEILSDRHRGADRRARRSCYIVTLRRRRLGPSLERAIRMRLLRRRLSGWTVPEGRQSASVGRPTNSKDARDRCDAAPPRQPRCLC